MSSASETALAFNRCAVCGGDLVCGRCKVGQAFCSDCSEGMDSNDYARGFKAGQGWCLRSLEVLLDASECSIAKEHIQACMLTVADYMGGL